MKNVMLAVMAVVVMSGCTAKTVEFVEGSQVAGQHDKAMEFLGSDRSDKGLVYKASPKAKECLKQKLYERGYWMLQDELDCLDNSIGK
jgi:uncharacterized protein YceK